MEDLSGWKSSSPGDYLTNDEIISCLKNTSILNAKFWGKKEILEKFGPALSERQDRPSRYSKMAEPLTKISSSTESILKHIEKLMSSEWPEHVFMKLPNNVPIPDWLTIAPLEDGKFEVMKDPLVKEMLHVYAERLPKYEKQKYHDFINKEPQTLLHGDYHAGNHMFGIDDNEGKVVALDFQCVGRGLVSSEFTYLIQSSWYGQNYGEIDKIANGTHFGQIILYPPHFDTSSAAKDLFEKSYCGLWWEGCGKPN